MLLRTARPSVILASSAEVGTAASAGGVIGALLMTAAARIAAPSLGNAAADARVKASSFIRGQGPGWGPILLPCSRV